MASHCLVLVDDVRDSVFEGDESWHQIGDMRYLGSSMFFFSCGCLPKVETTSVVLSYFTIQQNRGNPIKASGILII